MARNTFTKEEFQKTIDDKYGKNEWEIVTYNGFLSPIVARHKCGNIRNFNQAMTFKSHIIKCECEKLRGNAKVFQDKIDDKYGKNEWEIKKYTAMKQPVKAVHKCGKDVEFKLAETFMLTDAKCPKCNANKKMLAFQELLNSKYGENEWEIIEFEGASKPVKLNHKCGEEKILTRGQTLKSVNLKCEVCSRQKI